MKRIKILILAIWVFSLTACNDWLDVSATSELDRNDLFKTENGYAEALTGIYSAMCDASLYGRSLTFDVADILAGYYPNIMYDHACWYYGWYGDPTNSYYVNYCNPYIEGMWSGLYEGIANCNSILSTIDGNEDIFSDDNYRLIKGEALGLRAFLHFEVLRLFAPAYSIGKDEESIPYVTELSSLVTPLYTQEDALQAMLDDLMEAKALLENDPMRLGTTPDACLASIPSGSYLASDGIETWHNRRFHFNYYASVATMARIYMWMGDRTNALLAAREIIADQETKFPWVEESHVSNISETRYVRDQDRTFATEHIFALNVTDLDELMDAYIYNGTTGMNFSQNELSVYSISDVYENTVDYRYQYWFAPYTDSYGSSKFLLSKFYQNTTTADYFQERIPLIRLSEMYYIAAECAESVSDGVEYLEEVRRHRGLESAALGSSLSATELEEEIQKEYRKEFWGEGQLWYYYKRKSNMEFNGNMTDVGMFTFDMPDSEISNAGRE